MYYIIKIFLLTLKKYIRVDLFLEYDMILKVLKKTDLRQQGSRAHNIPAEAQNVNLKKRIVLSCLGLDAIFSCIQPKIKTEVKH